MSASLVALVPMRHHSERVPGKNYRLFAGKPLFHHIVTSLLACPPISRVVILTDSPEISESAETTFPQVQLIGLPKRLCGGRVPMNEVLLYAITHVESDYYLQTHSTTPLLRPETVIRAIRQFQDNYPAYDSLFSVIKMQARLWDSLARAINHNPAILLRTQDLPPLYIENACFFIFTGSNLEAQHNRIGKRPFMFELDREEAWDIDDEVDFRIAEFLYKELRPLPGDV